MTCELVKNINWVGYVDWTVRDFHSYVTSRGATYNSYLIQDEKTALVDTVKVYYAADLLCNISKFTSFDKIDYIVVNHAEPDHAGSLSKVLDVCKNATVVCNAKCKEILSGYNDTSSWKFHIVKTGDTLSLGSRTLTFMDTPMVHWPDSMFTYVVEDKLLFSMDAFGQHFASLNRFDDEVNMCEVMEEAKKYYANIVMCFGKQIAKVLEAASGLELKIVAPAHGIIWRSHLGEIVEAYKKWVTCAPKRKVLVVYDSMWESTGKMARAIVEGAAIDKSIEVKLASVRQSSLTEIVTEVLDSAAIAIGSSTLNQGMMPMMGALLTYLKGLKPTGKCGFSFGSFGWGKGGPEAVEEVMQQMKFDILREPLKAKWRPGHDSLAECFEAGKLLGEKALAVQE